MPGRGGVASYGAPWGNSEEIVVDSLHNLRYRRLRLRKRIKGLPPAGAYLRGHYDSDSGRTRHKRHHRYHDDRDAASRRPDPGKPPGGAGLRRRADQPGAAHPRRRVRWRPDAGTARRAAVFYWVSGFGITVGYHRYFTHGSFKAKTGLRVALAIAGSLAMEGPVITWVSDHRRHHKYSDKEGDPHSPWRYGDNARALAKGLFYAHMIWLFDPNQTSQQKFSPDLLADSKIRKVDKAFGPLVAVTLLLPALIGGLWGMSWQAAITAFFWASLVRITLLHHVTWSINSICHVFGNKDFEARDRSRNVSWLAIASFGESWHNLHHADPTCARHGALKGQIDQSARVIWAFEKLGWAYDVRWPEEARLSAKRPVTATRSLGGMTKRGEKAAKPVKPADRTAA
jgi:stearoyl-CoA desaturase (Delta-9 desaturase)